VIFFKKNHKKGAQTSFYFAAGGGEILVIHPHFLPNPIGVTTSPEIPFLCCVSFKNFVTTDPTK
jgi:hypothetical protein